MIVAWLALATIILALDQASKFLVTQTLELGERIVVWPMFSWIRLHNEGAAFSFLNDGGGWQRYLFSGLAIGFSIYLILEIRRLAASDWVQSLAYSLILGGALGNLVDRLARGHVVDFVLVHYEHHYFPAFNVADSAIFCGAVLWIWLLLREARAANSDADHA